MSEFQKEIEGWLQTWAPNCGAPKSVFVGQFNATMTRLFNELCLRGEQKGSHYLAMREVWEELQIVINQEMKNERKSK